MSAHQFLQYLTQVLFVLVFLVVTVRAIRQPRRAHADVALFFGVCAVLVIAGWVTSTLHLTPGRVATAALTTLFLALPYPLLRLVDDFAAVPRVWRVLGLGGFAV